MEAYEKRVLIIQAHPDDTESWCAGALALLRSKGYAISIATMTDGSLGGFGMTREETRNCRYEEARKAAAELDADFTMIGGQDGFLFDTQEMRIRTIELIRRVRPGIVLGHTPFDYHSDHRTAGEITEIACLLSTLPNVPCEEPPLEKTPLFYRTAPLTFSDVLGYPLPEPHFYLDITSVIEKKMAMLSHHKSQIEVMRVMHGIEDFFAFSKEYNREIGLKAGVTYGEYYWQHKGGGFQTYPLIQKELKKWIIEKEI